MKMITKLGLLGALGLAFAGFSGYAQTEAPAPEPGGPVPGMPHRPPPLGEVLNQIIERYDANHDGQLDATELAALRKDIEDGKIGPPPGAPGMPRPGARGPGLLPKEILDKYDLNKDGKLDENERAALRKDIEDGKIQPPFPGHGPRGPAGGPGPGHPPTAKEILARFDADQDGKLDETELTAFLNDLHQRLLRGPHGPPPGDGAPGAPPSGEPPQQ
jgi:Ca2+-binding EF-hand superfamily protein